MAEGGEGEGDAPDAAAAEQLAAAFAGGGGGEADRQELEALLNRCAASARKCIAAAGCHCCDCWITSD